MTVFALALNFIGTLLVFLDSCRMANRLPEDGITLGYDETHKTWYWRWCGRVGIALVGIGFLLSLLHELGWL